VRWRPNAFPACRLGRYFARRTRCDRCVGACDRRRAPPQSVRGLTADWLSLSPVQSPMNAVTPTCGVHRAALPRTRPGVTPQTNREKSNPQLCCTFVTRRAHEVSLSIYTPSPATLHLLHTSDSDRSYVVMRHCCMHSNIARSISIYTIVGASQVGTWHWAGDGERCSSFRCLGLVSVG